MSNTDLHIENLLDTKEFYWKPIFYQFNGNRIANAFIKLTRMYIDNKDEMENKLCNMNYRLFLCTGYWRIVSGYINYINHGKCEMCGGKEKINIHHKTYENRGKEIFHLEDLQCLCKTCHQTVHNNMKERISE